MVTQLLNKEELGLTPRLLDFLLIPSVKAQGDLLNLFLPSKPSRISDTHVYVYKMDK